MKKILILLVMLFVTGCGAKYSIDFTDDSVTESLVLSSVNSQEYDAIKNGTFAPVPAFKDSAINLEEPVKNEGVEYYDLRAVDNNVQLKYKFSLSDYENSYLGNLCYDYFKVFEEEDSIIFSTNNNFKCFYDWYDIDNFDVVMTTNHDVLFHNADEVTNDAYIWHVSKNTKDDESIQISFSKEAKKTVFSSGRVKLILIVSGIGLLILVLALIIYVRYKKVNSI